MKFLGGRAMVDRVPAATAITKTPDEQDYPAAATDRDGGVWVAYRTFTADPKFRGIRWTLPSDDEIKKFDELKEVNHGDQLMLARYANGVWSKPIAITEGRGDLFKPAVAADGSERVWVFWSANQGGNFDLYARPVVKNNPGRTIKLTTDSGPDVAGCRNRCEWKCDCRLAGISKRTISDSRNAPKKGDGIFGRDHSRVNQLQRMESCD
ncbi:MAG: hypothetical protein IPJ07_26965 [Acidobacteria bacterium]|nr:hypothetical protein [Acidobacteriota bacterium]